MAELAWVKLSAATFDDEKLQMVEGMPEGDAVLLMWIKLICLARKTNDKGLIYITPEIPYTEDLLAVKFHKPATLVRMAVETFQHLGMIEIFPDRKIWLVNWAKYQYLEGLEKVREQGRIRVARHRRHIARLVRIEDSGSKRNDVTQSNATVTLHGNDDVTQCNDAERREEEEEEREEGSGGIEAANAEGEQPSTEPKRQTKKEYAPDVWLSEAEYETLVTDYSEAETKALIGELSNALGNTIPVKHYKSHYKTLRNWIEKRRKDNAQKGVNPPVHLRTEGKEKTCPDCGKRYWGSACECGWGEQELREGKT